MDNHPTLYIDGTLHIINIHSYTLSNISFLHWKIKLKASLKVEINNNTKTNIVLARSFFSSIHSQLFIGIYLHSYSKWESFHLEPQFVLFMVFKKPTQTNSESLQWSHTENINSLLTFCRDPVPSPPWQLSPAILVTRSLKEEDCFFKAYVTWCDYGSKQGKNNSTFKEIYFNTPSK